MNDAPLRLRDLIERLVEGGVGFVLPRKTDLDGTTVRICSLEHLVQMKRASDRPRDLDDLEALEVAGAERETDPPPSA